MRYWLILLLCINVFLSGYALAGEPLASWAEGPVKESIISFVKSVTNKTSPDFVPVEDRIAVIDNDGTLWVEQPLYTQFIFTIYRFREMAASHPEWKKQPEINALLKKDDKSLDMNDLQKMFILTIEGTSVEKYRQQAKEWLAKAVNPHFNHHYTQLVYLPMLEVIHYLSENHFTIYIVSGGGQNFIRAFAPEVYQIPLDRIIGTAGKTQYGYNQGKPTLINLPDILFVSDKVGKPEAINLFIGKKPIIAFGNSDGDKQMLEWTQSGPGKRLMLLVHHDDSKREYAYDVNSKVGTFPSSLFAEAKQNGWQIISMKNDWKKIFAFN